MRDLSAPDVWRRDEPYEAPGVTWSLGDTVDSRLTVIGGSTPFTAALVDAIEARGEAIPPQGLMLNGRDQRNLATISRYARKRLSCLGWRVEWTEDAHEALSGARIVIHQARYGGNAGRQMDEDLALSCGLTPDETLGPSALQCALRTFPLLKSTCRSITQECPDAWVLNLTNPLSIMTALMIKAGVKHCIGLCELPRVTVQQASAVLGEDPALANWSYAGLNHRGFIVRLAWDGKDRIRDVSRCLGNDTLEGIRGDEIAALGAIPTKYFRLLRGDVPVPQGGRAAFLEQLRHRILAELHTDPGQSPPSLSHRYLAWYPDSVVPFIEALCSPRPVLMEVNTLSDRGVVEEGRALVSSAGIGALVTANVPRPVACWIGRLVQHEHLLLDAVEQPSLSSIRRAIAADPTVASSKVDDCARKVCGGFMRYQAAGMVSVPRSD